MKISRGWMVVALVAAVALAMGLSLRNGFVYDDLPAIVRNARITNPAQWHTIPSAPYWLGTLWRPLTVSLFALQWWIGHGAAWVFHLVSLAGYFAVGLLLCRLLLRLELTATAAGAAAVLFLVHPVHVEVVANGVGQSELWTTLALLGATIIYVRARQCGVTPMVVIALLAVVAFGITAKEEGFTVPLLLAGAEWLLLRDRDERVSARIRMLIPAAMVTATLFLLRATLLGSVTGEIPAIALRHLNWAGRAVTFLGTIPEYARLVFWPMHLQADYGPPGIPVGGPITLRHLFGALLLAGYIGLFVRCRRRAPVAAFGLFWAAVTLAPVSNLLTPSGIVMAERVMFLPTIGLAIAAGGWIGSKRASERARERARENPRRREREILILVATVWAAALCVRSATRVPTWKSQDRFFTDITRDAPRAYRAWSVAGDYWYDTGDRSRAVASVRHAIQLWPHDYTVSEHLGQYLRSDGRCDEAIPVFAAGLTEYPEESSLRAKLIECLIAERQWDVAERYVQEALARGQTEFQSTAARLAKLRAAPAK